MESTLGGPHRGGRDITPDVLPASQYLQERLQERRARNMRPKRLRQSDFGPRPGRDDDIFALEGESTAPATSRMFDSSPLVAASRSGADLSDANKKRSLGAKGMDEHLDRLTKENFALKLELDHRREHTSKLQEKIEAMQAQIDRAEQLQEEHTELLRINSQLVEELEKRDKAVEEAMDIICDLEDKVADLDERGSATRPSTANADSGYAGTETQEQAPASSPPELSKARPKTPSNARHPTAAASAATDRLVNVVNGKTPARPKREPLVLSQKKQSTHALRSVYLEATQALHPVQSFNSLLTRQENRNEDDAETLNSPRLSVLSESSFPSIYSPKKLTSPDRYDWEAKDDDPLASIYQPTPHVRQDSINRVSKWMDERDLPEETPSKSNRITSPLSQKSENDMASSSFTKADASTGFRSLANPSSPKPRPARLLQPGAQEPVQYIQPFPIRTDRQANKGTRPPSFGGPIFGEPLLPPTPESASTRMLRGSRSSIDNEQSLLDTTPAVVRGYDALEPGVRTAPRQMRSSVELNSAYVSYIRRSDDHALEEDDGLDNDNADASSETVRDLSMDYDGFPDGGSILMGTPSRFLKHGNPPTPKVPNSARNFSPSETRQPQLNRRKTSSGATSGPRKPSFSRAETSPSLHYGYGRTMNTNPQSYSASVTSPGSYHSGSSSNRTAFQPAERDRTISPDLFRIEPRPMNTAASPPRSRTSPSPGRTFGQKAHGLLRRLSNTQRDSGSDREKSPLPTLTTAPSSVYVNDIPRDVRRPGTSYSGGENMNHPGQRIVQTREDQRPSVQTRTNTAPNVAAFSLSAFTERKSLDAERKNLFKRSNSAKKWPQTPMQDAHTPMQDVGSSAKTKRRNSIREAVASAAAMRPWR